MTTVVPLAPLVNHAVLAASDTRTVSPAGMLILVLIVAVVALAWAAKHSNTTVMVVSLGDVIRFAVKTILTTLLILGALVLIVIISMVH